MGDPAAEDSLRDFAKHVESISEEVPDCEGIASHDQIENGIPVDTPAESNIFPEEVSDDSDDDLDIDIDEPEPAQPQPRLPQIDLVHMGIRLPIMRSYSKGNDF